MLCYLMLSAIKNSIILQLPMKKLLLRRVCHGYLRRFGSQKESGVVLLLSGFRFCFLFVEFLSVLVSASSFLLQMLLIDFIFHVYVKQMNYIYAIVPFPIIGDLADVLHEESTYQLSRFGLLLPKSLRSIHSFFETRKFHSFLAVSLHSV
jgi:hypothetical protein